MGEWHKDAEQRATRVAGGERLHRGTRAHPAAENQGVGHRLGGRVHRHRLPIDEALLHAGGVAPGRDMVGLERRVIEPGGGRAPRQGDVDRVA